MGSLGRTGKYPGTVVKKPKIKVPKRKTKKSRAAQLRDRIELMYLNW